MRKSIVILLGLVATVAVAGEDAPWVDLVNCSICKNLSAEEGLLANMVWEHHLTATGVMTVSTVNPEYQVQYDRALGKIQKTVGLVMAGDEMYICNYCTSFTSLLKAGVQMDNIVTHGSHIILLSSVDEALIAKIHTHGQNVIFFLNPSNEGHGHQ